MNNITVKFIMKGSKGIHLHITWNVIRTQKMSNKILGTVEQVFTVQ